MAAAADKRILRGKKALETLRGTKAPDPDVFAQATKGMGPADTLTVAVLTAGVSGLDDLLPKSGSSSLSALMNSCPACAKPWSTQVRANSPMQDMMLGFLEQTPPRADRVGVDIQVRRALKQFVRDCEMRKRADQDAQKIAQDRELIQRLKCLEVTTFGKDLEVRELARSETQLVLAATSRLCDALTSVMGASAEGRSSEYADLVFGGTHRVLMGYRKEFDKIPVAVLMFKECGKQVIYIELMGAWRNSGGSVLVAKLKELARAEGFHALLAEAFYPDPEAMHLAPAREETRGFWLDAMKWEDLSTGEGRCCFLNEIRAKQQKRKHTMRPTLTRFFADLGYTSPYEKGDFLPVGTVL